MKITPFLILLAIGALFILTAGPGWSQSPADPIETRVYDVRPDFLSLGGAAAEDVSDDPFADDEPAESSKTHDPKAAQRILEAAGVTFPDETAATFDPETATLTVTQSKVMHELVATFLEQNQSDAQKHVRILVEAITLPHSIAVDLVREHMGTGDSTLRTALKKMLRNGTAEVTASTIVTTRSGQRARVDSISEEIYPTEYDPGDFPHSITGKLNGNPNFIVGVRATAAETRGAGITLEIDPVVGADAWTIDMNFAFDQVDLIGSTVYDSGYSQLSQPVFYTQKISTAFTVCNGTSQLVGMTTPPPSDQSRANYENDRRTLVFVQPIIGRKTPIPVAATQHPNAKHVSTLLEAFEMDARDAAEMMRMDTGFLDDTEMRDRALELIASGQAKRRESSYLITRSGQPAKTESVKEVIYPTEMHGPQVPKEAIVDADTKKMILPATCTAFETRNIGTTFELDPTLLDGVAIDMSVAPELSELIGWDSYGRKESKIEQPVFSTSNLKGTTRLVDRQPVLYASYTLLDRTTQRPQNDRRIVLFLTAATQEVKP